MKAGLTVEDQHGASQIVESDGPLLLDSIIPYQINLLTNSMNRLLDKDLRDEGLSITYWRVMAVLDFNTSVSVNELADYAMIEQSTLSRSLQKMQQKNLIDIKQSEDDGRVRHIFLTPHGREQYSIGRRITMRHVNRIVSGFSPDDRVQLMRFITQMRNNIETAPLPR